MSRVVTIPLPSSTSTRPYVVDRDTVLVTAQASPVGGSVNIVLSTDPSLTAAILTAAPAASVGVTADIICMVSNSSGSLPLKIPLKKGTTLYLATNVGTWVFLQFDDSLSAEISAT